MRAVLLLLLIVAAGLVALWRFDVVSLPFLQSRVETVTVSPIFTALEADAGLAEALAAASDPDPRNAAGLTPLMVAASGADLDPVWDLLDAGADVGAVGPEGMTPLHFASRDSGSPEVTLLLMNAGADPTVRDAEGRSALELAAANPALRSTGLMDRIEALLETGFQTGWPSAYVVPVEGATLSSRASHLPGAPRAYRNGTHEGFDFYNGTVSVPIRYGTPIRAVATGTVVRADLAYQEMTLEGYDEIITEATRSLTTPPEVLDRLRGRQVWIEHPGGFVSRYAHLSAVAEGLEVGDRVAQGDVIGSTGNSGTLEAARATEDDPHPHVEIWRGDTYLGQGLEPDAIYALAAQLFGPAAMPPFTD